MATAEKSTVERVVTEEGFVLHLSTAEAETLVAVLAHVGGDPEESPRGDAERVLNALRDSGVRNFYPKHTDHPSRLAHGSITFDDYATEA
ncbi:hypothetical protein [Streptomyces silvensis]|uniref:Uncharacterized protein n=1 Tax=Streptomyces silvensis TaxID=1765722 RepID=A0A0W7X7A7_9ACTN|nr:hypothetical protein [Streptomyces silvensis]KUF18838.1 hypothetical protein AT728_07330 [Streptomyces silvensis]